MADRPADPARLLVEAGVVSIEQVDVLIAIAACGSDGCSAKQLHTATQSGDERIQASLAALEQIRLIEPDGSDPPRWRLSRKDLEGPINDLAVELRKRRKRVVNEFYAIRLDSLRAFSDAFRIRRDK